MAHPIYPLWFVTRPHWRTLLRIWQRTAFVCRFNTLTHRLEGQKKVGGTTAQAIELRQSGENSILGNIAVNVNSSLTQVLRSAC